MYLIHIHDTDENVIDRYRIFDKHGDALKEYRRLIGHYVEHLDMDYYAEILEVDRIDDITNFISGMLNNPPDHIVLDGDSWISLIKMKKGVYSHRS